MRIVEKRSYVSRIAFSIFTVLLWLFPGNCMSEVSLEKVIQIRDFSFLQDRSNENKFYYLPMEPRLARKADGSLDFTFIKYHKAGGEADDNSSGGIVHFLVQWGLDHKQLSRAQAALRSKYPKGRLMGPVPFKEGTFSVISASAGKDGLFTRRIVGEGKAPLVPGAKAAVSIALEPSGATLLERSFQSPTSDVSVVFMLTYAGLAPSYNATLRVNWDKVYTQHNIKAGVDAVIYGVRLKADVQAMLEELRQSGAIELDVQGESANMDRLLNTAYEHVLRLMFDPQVIPPQNNSQGGDGESDSAEGVGEAVSSAASAVSDIVGSGENEGGGSSEGGGGGILPTITIGYTFKRAKQTGLYEVDMRQAVREERIHTMAGNIGNIVQSAADRDKYFKLVDLDDPELKQRTVKVILDGMDHSDLVEFVNAVMVDFKRVDGYGKERLDQIDFVANTLRQHGNILEWRYARGASSLNEWLNYDYQVSWSFFGGGVTRSEWVATDDSVLALSPPVKHRKIRLVLKQADIEKNNILAVTFQFKHNLFGKNQSKEVLLDLSDPDRATTSFEYEYIHPIEKSSYHIRTIWTKMDGTEITHDWQEKNSRFLMVTSTDQNP